MDTAQWPQGIVMKPIEEIIPNIGTSSKPVGATERKARPQKEQALNCPRCNSTNTKFCYYNNYSLSQPRYFCKTCRRYWTEGGSLRNIPVGGGSRKNKRSTNLSSSSPSSSSKLQLVHDLSSNSTQNPNGIHEGQDLSLAFPITHDFRNISEFVQLPTTSIENNKNHMSPSSASNTTSHHLSALELLTGITSRGFNSFMPISISDPNTVYNASGFSMQDFKPTLNISLDGLGNGGYGTALQGVQENSNGSVLFPFEDLKHASNATEQAEQNKGQGDSTGYWTGMLGGGSW